MNLIQSICCFFSSRCASGAAAEEGGCCKPTIWAPLRHHVVPATPDTEVASGAGVQRALRPRDLGPGHLAYRGRRSRGPKEAQGVARVDNRCKVAEMPLTRLKNEYMEQDGVRFLMEDTEGSTVACSVSHEALRDDAERVHLSGTDAAVFEAYRELIEQVASDAYDAEGPFDDNGRVLVNSEALARVTRSA